MQRLLQFLMKENIFTQEIYVHAKYIFLNIFKCKGIQDILQGLGTPSYRSVCSSLDCVLLSKMQEIMDTLVPTAEAE